VRKAANYAVASGVGICRACSTTPCTGPWSFTRGSVVRQAERRPRLQPVQGKELLSSGGASTAPSARPRPGTSSPPPLGPDAPLALTADPEEPQEVASTSDLQPSSGTTLSRRWRAGFKTASNEVSTPGHLVELPRPGSASAASPQQGGVPLPHTMPDINPYADTPSTRPKRTFDVFIRTRIPRPAALACVATRRVSSRARQPACRCRPGEGLRGIPKLAFLDLTP